MINWKTFAQSGATLLAVEQPEPVTMIGAAVVIVGTLAGLWRDYCARKVVTETLKAEAAKAEQRHKWDVEMRQQDRLDRLAHRAEVKGELRTVAVLTAETKEVIRGDIRENTAINVAALDAANHVNEKLARMGVAVAADPIAVDTNETAHRIESKL